MAFKIFRKNCCGLDVHKTWIYACIGITDANNCTEYKQARFSSFSKGLQELSSWLAKYSCTEVCMESSGKYWIPVFNILEKTCWVTLAHPKYTKPQKGNKTDRKDAKWICDLFMCDMIKPSFIPPPDIRHLRDLLRFRMKLTYQITGMKNRALNCLTVSNLKLDDVFTDVFGKSSRSIIQQILDHPNVNFDVTPYVDKHCKHPIEEIQAAIDGAICTEQATKLKICLDFIDELRDMGAYIQMNADSIIGEDGFMIKRFCKKVIKEEMLDFVGSDGHDLARRTPHIGKCYDKIEKMMGTDYADMIFISNPECIINNERF